ncbi:MAG TPA: four helix bundle protein [Flavisolibacter sp.]|nr:four helix bundle protein [Flavisolibacter sp.]
MINSVSGLEVVTRLYTLAMNSFNPSRNFPREEQYSLTDQIVRASRSVAATIAEGRCRRVYEKEFRKRLIMQQVQ